MDGIAGPVGAQGAQGAQGPQGPTGATGPFGTNGMNMPDGIFNMQMLTTPPSSSGLGYYLDSGANTADGLPGFRFWNGSTWVD